MTSTAVGIHFGTTQSRINVLQDGSLVTNECVRSCVVVTAQGPVVGSAAEEAGADPLNTVRGVKMMLGQPYRRARSLLVLGQGPRDPRRDGVLIRTGLGQEFVPEQIAAIILRKMLDLSARPVEEAVITVPSYFNAAERVAVTHAGRIAGLQKVHLINATSAAAVAYASVVREGKKIVVVHIGDGGGSVAVADTMKDGFVKVLATSATRLPGGVDVDEELITFFKNVLKKEYKKEVSKGGLAEQALRAAWREAKPQLSARHTVTSVKAYLPEIDVHFDMLITLQYLEKELSNCLLVPLLSALTTTLTTAGVEKDHIDDVILIGGCTRMSKVRSSVAEYFGGKVQFGAVDQETSVVMGAALYAAALRAHTDVLLLKEVTPLRVTYTTGGVSAFLFPANDSGLPRAKELFLPHQHLQELLLRVEQGEDASRQIVLWLELSSGKSPQMHVKFIQNSDGTIHCSGEQDTVINGLHFQNCLSEVDFQQLCLSSVKSHTPSKDKVVETPRLKVIESNSKPEREEAPASTSINAVNGDNLHDDDIMQNGAGSEEGPQHAVCNGLEHHPESKPIEMDRAPLTVQNEDRNALEMLFKDLYEQISNQDDINRSDHPKTSLVQDIMRRGASVLQSLADTVLSGVMKEVAAAGLFSLLVDLTVTHERDVVSLMIRYCRSNGDVVERLVALLDARGVTGDVLIERFTCLCEKHAVNWGLALCGVSMDAAASMKTAYSRMLKLLQQKAPQVQLVWNGAHSLCDLIAQSCACNDLGNSFFGALDTFRDFFSVTKRAAVLAEECHGRSVVCLDSYEDAVSFVYSNHAEILKVLGSLGNSDYVTGYIAQALLGSLKSEDFRAVLALFRKIFETLVRLSTYLNFSGSLKLPVIAELHDVLGKFYRVDSFLGDVVSPGASTHLTVAMENLLFLSASACESHVTDSLSAMRALSQTSISQRLRTLPLLPALGGIRKLEVLRSCLSASKRSGAVEEAVMIMVCAPCGQTNR